MKGNFQHVGRRAWAAVMAALLVLTTVAGSVTLPVKTAKAGESSVLIDSNFANLAAADAETGWWLYDAQNDGNWANCAATITAEGAGLNIDYTGNTGGFYDAIWGIQVPQMMTVEAGVPYTLSFDVESTGTKGIKAKVDGMESVLDSDFTATAGTQTFTVENVTFDTTGTVKFLFALGWVAGDDSAVEITISNVTMTPPPVEEDYGIIVDGDFENLAAAEVTEGWWIYDAQNDGNWANCAAAITATGNGLNVNYTGNYGGFYDAIWGIQVPQWITVEAGVPYTLSFDVASTGTKGIKIKIDGKEAILDSDFTAAAGTQTFTVENVTFDAAGSEKLLFALGWMSGDDTAADVTISNVKMIAGEAEPPAPTVEDIIVDGNFASMASEEVTEGWWIYDAQNDGNWANCAAAITATGAGLEINYTGNNGGFYDAIWGIQVPQWINVEAGVPYTLSFDVESTGTKGIKVKAEGQETVLDNEYTATAGTQTFTVENVTFDTTGALKLLFALGWMSGDDSVVDIKISNVTMTYEVSAETPDGPGEPSVTDPIAYAGKTVEEMEEAGYTLVWSDEFDGDSLDLTKWDYQIGNGQTASNNAGWGNQEAEYYTNSENNVSVSDGYLTITALKETVTDPAEGTFYYTSGRIRTTSDVNGQLFATKYGRIEAQMILPTEEGAWPAFWMLPQDQYIYNGWAASGELDIMEGYGDKPNVVGGTIHYGSQWPNNIYKGQSYYFDNTTDTSVFHTYGVEWEPGKITWFVDDEAFYTADTWYSITAGTAENNTFDAPFDVPFYILLNVAVNGTWDAGEADNGDYTGNGKSSMIVDYVRVYSKNDVDYDNQTPPSANGGSTDADAYMEYVYPLCGDNYEGYNFVQDEAFDTLKTVDVVDPVDSDWQFYVGDFGGAATCNVTDGVANVEITSSGNQTYAIQLIKHMPMLKGYNYKVTFDAYADEDRNITVHPSGDADNGWAGYAAETIAITTENQTYSFSFNMGNDSDPTARLEFNLGSAGTANVHISNVKFEMIERIETDDTVEKTPLSDGNLIWNGSFDEGDSRLAYWTIEDASVVVPNFVDYVINPSDHVVRNDRTGVNENYERRAIVNGTGSLMQSGLTLKQSEQYRLTFEGYTAEEDQVVEVLVYGEGVYVMDFIPLTVGSENQYEVVFAMPKGITDSNVTVDLYSCNGGEIQLDDVKMYAITNNNSDMDYSDVVAEPVPDNSDGFYVNYYTAANEPAAPDGDGVYTIQTWKDTNNYQSMFLHVVELTEGVDYVLSFDAKSDVENTYEVAIQQDNTWAMAWGPDTFTTGTEWNTYTFNFTSALSTAGGDTTYLKYLLTSCANTSNLYLKNITLKAVLPEGEGVGDAPEGTAVLESDVITEGEDAVIVLADNAWTQKFLEMSNGYGAVIMVDETALDYTVLPSIIDGNRITISSDYLYEGTRFIELALNGYYNIVLPLTVEAAETPAEVDKSLLQETIELSQNVTEEDYTAESYAAFVEAYNHAAAVLADPDATQEEVDAEVAALKQAIMDLIPAGGLTPDDGGETGDFHVYLYVLLMAAALGTGAIALYDRKKRA